MRTWGIAPGVGAAHDGEDGAGAPSDRLRAAIGDGLARSALDDLRRAHASLTIKASVLAIAAIGLVLLWYAVQEGSLASRGGLRVQDVRPGAVVQASTQ